MLYEFLERSALASLNTLGSRLLREKERNSLIKLKVLQYKSCEIVVCKTHYKLGENFRNPCF